MMSEIFGLRQQQESRDSIRKQIFHQLLHQKWLPDLPFQSVFYKNDKGIIYEGASNLFMTFDPEKLNAPSPAPPVYFTALKINNAPVNTESISSSLLKLKYDQNTVIISYTAPEFNNPGDIRYLIKMDGADKEWRDEGSQSTVTYASLSPGDYVFM